MSYFTFKGGTWLERSARTGDDVVGNIPGDNRIHLWMEESEGKAANVLHSDTANKGKEALWGSLIYRQSQTTKEDLDVFHFFLSEDILVTNELEYEIEEDLNKGKILNQMEEATSNVELIMILLGDMVSSILHRIDLFEERLRTLLWAIKEENDKKIFDEIVEVRHEVLMWKNMVLGFREIRMAVAETFGSDMTEGTEYKRTSIRIDRCVMLIDSYEDEVINMIDMENVAANYRGNEIIKTLTVLTALFTPLMAFGALWGMNFVNMPELYWEWGYWASLALIAGATIGLYLYLRRKGWMGNLLGNPAKKK
ncbi:MAG TPA: magnesium transporter CorA family protein [Planococcus sp. (in: firmicutes)]|nr:magnesium transporter CorA family protein [Planococcus sp. (in: firmicutes)]